MFFERTLPTGELPRFLKNIFLNEVHESAASVRRLAPIICGARSLSE
jgi:hypothetical protein